APRRRRRAAARSTPPRRQRRRLPGASGHGGAGRRARAASRRRYTSRAPTAIGRARIPPGGLATGRAPRNLVARKDRRPMAQQDRLEIARRHRASWTASQPFVLGVIGHFSGRQKAELPYLGEGVGERSFRDVRLDTFDALIASIAPIARIEVEDHLSGGGMLSLEIAFRALAEFAPTSLAERVPALAP